MSQVMPRSPRRTEFWSVRTPDGVGPGKYESQYCEKRPSARLPSSPRAGISSLDTSVPGPGTYDIDRRTVSPGNVRGSLSFISEQPRWTETGKTVSPGPGSYSPAEGKQTAAKRHIVKVMAQPTSLSIPMVPRYTSEVSPTTYTPVMSLVRTRAVAPAFIESTDDRSLWLDLKTVPGPGAYFHSPAAAESPRCNAVFASKVPQLQQMGAITPGPGAYNPPLEIGEVLHEQVAGFNSSTDRECMRVRKLQKYRPQLEGARWKSDMRRRPPIPFDSLEKRDCLSALKTDSSPGPGYYSPGELILESIEPVAKSTIPPRFKPSYFDPRPGPAPGEYRAEGVKPASTAACASFKSESPRFPQPRQHSPEAGNYQKLRKWSCPKRLGVVASFATAASRFVAEEAFPGCKISVNPGPGHYHTDREKANRPSLPISKSPRFEVIQHSYDGPGRYYYQSSLIKKTFNATVKVQQSRLR